MMDEKAVAEMMRVIDQVPVSDDEVMQAIWNKAGSSGDPWFTLLSRGYCYGYVVGKREERARKRREEA